VTAVFNDNLRDPIVYTETLNTQTSIAAPIDITAGPVILGRDAVNKIQPAIDELDSAALPLFGVRNDLKHCPIIRVTSGFCDTVHNFHFDPLSDDECS
jgi:hypothetical protein